MNIKNKTTRNSLICYFVIVALFVTIRLLSSFGVLDFLGSVGNYIANAFVQIGILFTISVFMFSGLQKSKPKDILRFYGFKKMSWKAVLYSFLLGIVVYILNVFVVTFFRVVLTALGYTYSTGSTITSYPFWLLIVNLIVSAVLPAICEETAHRGMLLRGLSNKGAMKSIVISSLLFGLMHLNIEQFFYATIIGLLLGTITMFCDTIYPAIIIHFMNNALSTFMTFSSVNNLGFDGMFNWINFNLVNNPVTAILFTICLITLLIFALIFLFKRIYRETAVKRIHMLQEALFTEVMRSNYYEELREISNQDGMQVGDSEDDEIEKKEKEFDKIFQTKAIDTGNASELSNAIMMEDEPYKPDKLSNILLTMCIVLTAAVTLMTFIWGVL